MIVAMVAMHALAMLTRWLLYGAYGGPLLAGLLVYACLAGLLVASTAPRWRERFLRLKQGAVRHDRAVALALAACVLVAGAIHAKWRWNSRDEMALLAASRIIADRGVAEFFAGYASLDWLGNQHPPLMPLLYGFAMRIFGLGLFGLRLWSVAAMAATVLLTWELARALCDRATALLAAFLLLSSAFFFPVGTWAVGDMLAALLVTVAMRALLALERRPSAFASLTAGAALGVGSLTKYLTVLLYPVVLAEAFALGWFRRIPRHVATVLLAGLGMLALWLAYAWWIGVLQLHLASVGRYASTPTRSYRAFRWTARQLLGGCVPAFGASTLPFLALGVAHRARSGRDEDRFLLAWLVPVLGTIAVTTPEPRYMLLAAPAAAIVAASELERRSEIEPAALVLTVLLWVPKLVAGVIDTER